MAGGEYNPLPAGARRIMEHLSRPHPCKREDFLVRWKKRKKGGFPMRLLLKILFAPVMLALILVVHFAAFLLSVPVFSRWQEPCLQFWRRSSSLPSTARTASSFLSSRSSSARSVCRCWQRGCSGNCRICDMPFKTGFTKNCAGWSLRSSSAFSYFHASACFFRSSNSCRSSALVGRTLAFPQSGHCVQGAAAAKI